MENIQNFFLDRTCDFVDYVKYDVLGVSSPDVPEIPLPIKVIIHVRKNITWISFPEYPGLFASGKNQIELLESVNDAVYSYFGIPRYVAKKLGNRLGLPLPDGTVLLDRQNRKFAGA